MIPCTYCDGLSQLPFMHFCRVMNIERRRSSGSTDANLDWAKSSMCTSAQRLSSWSLQSYGRGCRPPVGVPTDARNPLAEVKAMASVTYCHLRSQCKSQKTAEACMPRYKTNRTTDRSQHTCAPQLLRRRHKCPVQLARFRSTLYQNHVRNIVPNNFQPHNSSL